MASGSGVIISWSTDGGLTWTQYETAGGDYKYPGSRADPAVAIREADGLWVVGLLTQIPEFETVALLSDDGGETWTKVRVVTPDPSKFDDILHLRVDNNVGSPGYGDIYFAWQRSDLDTVIEGKRYRSSPRILVCRADWNETLALNGAQVWSE